MAEAPTCSQCSRPLQRSMSNCIYCGHELTKEERENVESAFNEQTVKQQVEQVEAKLDASTRSIISATGKIVGKAAVIVLSVAAALFLSWVSEWNPVIIGVAVIFFSLPIWQVLRR